MRELFKNLESGHYFRIADNQGIECLREAPGSYDRPSGELGHTLTIDNR
jgi:hypothetical protein